MATIVRKGERIADLQSQKPSQSSSTADESLNQSFVYAQNQDGFACTSDDATTNEPDNICSDKMAEGLNSNIKRKGDQTAVLNNTQVD